VLFETVPLVDGAERGGFMRRFLTLVCLLGLALPAGISISGCTRNPAGKYCNGLGYGLLDTAVASITLQPQIAGISLAYGQTVQSQSPSAYTCKGGAASVASGTYHYGTTNNQLVDISPSGDICAGTWNRNTGGGIADYTYCYYPDPLPSTNGLPYGIAYITATADSVTSNPVTVYIHAPISSINLVTTPASGTSASPTGCYSQSQQAQLDAQAFYNLNGVQTLLCEPGSTTLPECSSSIGTLNFAVGTSSVASINAATNVITAEQPGTTVITATIAQSSSSAGYFSTCPPKSISVNLANGSTSGIVTQGVSQNLTTTVTDTQGNQITGLSLSYQSTNPIDISATSSGTITAAYPGVASVYATCQPPTCNPAPINELGVSGTGLSLTSNPVNIIVPGTTSDFAWFGAPGQSQYFSSIELLTGNPGSTVRLPYVPNSMVMDQSGDNLYFGSPRELMIYSTGTNSLTKQDTTAPGIVLAASPSASQILINDQIRGLFYLYNVSAGTSLTQGGFGVAAAWTPDSNTLYIVDSAAANSLPENIAAGITGHTDTLYVYNVNTGWSSSKLACSTSDVSPAVCNSSLGTTVSSGATSLAVTVPGIGTYLSGDPTVAHTWCPSGIVGNNASIEFYPQSDSVTAETQALAATSNGQHILGATLNGASISLTDIGLNIPPSTAYPSAECPEMFTPTTQTLSSLSTNPTIDGTVNLTGVTNATSVNQVVPGSAPTTASVTTAAPIAFVTYNTPSTSTAAAQLPFYLPKASGAGPVGYVTFSQSNPLNTPTSTTPPTAPLAGAFSPDNSVFFVSTAGDNEIHFISIPTNVTTAAPTAPTDTQQFSPNLPACTPVPEGGNDAGCQYPTTLPVPTSTTYVPATVITVKPRSVT
jgi:trimeric autotransporter adhesin